MLYLQYRGFPFNMFRVHKVWEHSAPHSFLNLWSFFSNVIQFPILRFMRLHITMFVILHTDHVMIDYGLRSLEAWNKESESVVPTGTPMTLELHLWINQPFHCTAPCVSNVFVRCPPLCIHWAPYLVAFGQLLHHQLVQEARVWEAWDWIEPWNYSS